MLTKKQINEVKEHLERAQRPLFFFDNDQDGLCSFLLLQRWLGRGKGVAVKSFPELVPEYFRKVHELKADYIFILDKPVVSREFFNKAEQFNIPVVWIDHHEPDKNAEPTPEFVNRYNPLFNKPASEEPVTALCYNVTGKKEDIWLALAGCIADNYVPPFYQEFRKKYPELALESGKDKVKAFDIFYKSQIGRISRMLGFALKDRTTNVVKMMKFMMKVRSPHEVLEEKSANKSMYKRYNQIDSKYQRLLKKAIDIGKNKEEKLLFFQYGGDLSISSDLASELYYLFPKKTIAVLYVKGLKANVSMRGKKAKRFLLEAIKELENSRGGGHDEAVGGQIQSSDIEKFRENLGRLAK